MGASGTAFILHDKGKGVVTLEAAGVKTGDKFLDGVKKTGSEVGLGGDGGTGTKWKIHEKSGGKVQLECLDCSGSKKYLDGNQSGGALQVGLGISGNTGTLWNMVKLGDGRVMLECADKGTGPKYLVASGDGIPAPTSAPSAPSKQVIQAPSSGGAALSGSKESSSGKGSSDSKSSTASKSPDIQMGEGTRFKVAEMGKGIVALEVAGLNKSDRFLDGVKQEGSEVGLGVSGGKGTNWKIVNAKDGLVRLECVDCKGDKKYLDGRKSEGTMEVGLGNKDSQGTLWRIINQPDGTAVVECADKGSGPKNLTLLVDNKAFNAPVAKPISKPSDSKKTTVSDDKKIGAPSGPKVTADRPKGPAEKTRSSVSPGSSEVIKVTESTEAGKTVLKVAKNASSTNDVVIKVAEALSGKEMLPLIVVSDTPNAKVYTDQTEHFTIRYYDPKLKDVVKGLKEGGYIEDAYAAARTVIGAPTELPERKTELIFLSSNQMPGGAGGWQIPTTNVILVNVGPEPLLAKMGRSSDSLSSVGQRIAHEVTHKLFEDKVLSGLFRKDNLLSRNEREQIVGFSAEYLKNEYTSLSAASEGLAYYVQAKEYKHHTLGGLADPLKFTGEPKGWWSSWGWSGAAEQYNKEIRTNDGHVSDATLKPLMDIGAQLAIIGKGQDKYAQLHQFLEYVGMGDATGEAVRKAYGAIWQDASGTRLGGGGVYSW